LLAAEICISFQDPLINDNFKTLKEEIAGYEKQLQETKENLDAVKFDQVRPCLLCALISPFSIYTTAGESPRAKVDCKMQALAQRKQSFSERN